MITPKNPTKTEPTSLTADAETRSITSDAPPSYVSAIGISRAPSFTSTVNPSSRIDPATRGFEHDAPSNAKINLHAASPSPVKPKANPAPTPTLSSTPPPQLTASPLPSRRRGCRARREEAQLAAALSTLSVQDAPSRRRGFWARKHELRTAQSQTRVSTRRGCGRHEGGCCARKRAWREEKVRKEAEAVAALGLSVVNEKPAVREKRGLAKLFGW